MKELQVECGACRVPCSVVLHTASSDTLCPQCGAPMQVEVFPALLRPMTQGRKGETVLVDDESTCFYHPGKRAAVPCDRCGRFLCALCDIVVAGEHLCPTCIEGGLEKGKLDRLRQRWIHYDDIALSTAILPAIFVWPTLVTAPVALFMVFYFWKRPLSASPRRRWRFVIAGLAAGIELALWGWGLLSLIGGAFQ